MRNAAVNKQPRPSIYDRLMPLMYALIGAASTLFLNALFCGRPMVSRGSRCRPASAMRPVAVAQPGASRRGAVLPDAASRGPDGTAGVLARGGAADASAGAPTAAAVERLLAGVIGPCVRVRARSFRLAVHLRADGRVRRSFVARDRGVTTAMVACIQRQLAGIVLPMKPPPGGYAEWRVRQVDGLLTLRLVRPRR